MAGESDPRRGRKQLLVAAWALYVPSFIAPAVAISHDQVWRGWQAALGSVILLAQIPLGRNNPETPIQAALLSFALFANVAVLTSPLTLMQRARGWGLANWNLVLGTFALVPLFVLSVSTLEAGYWLWLCAVVMAVVATQGRRSAKEIVAPATITAVALALAMLLPVIGERNRRAIPEARLMEAIEGSDLQALSAAVSAGAQINATDALSEAARRGDRAIVDYLLAQGALVEGPASTPFTPLHAASQSGKSEIARLLLERGADREARDWSGQRPLHFAAEYGHADLVALLLAAGASVDATDSSGFTPLHRAMYLGNMEVVRRLLNAGAEPDARTDQNTTPLYYAARRENLELAAELIQRGVEVDARSSEYDWTPLVQAVLNRRVEMVAYLLSAGADPKQRATNGATPLHYAAQGQPDIVRLLTDAGANVLAQDEDGRTPLHWAARWTHDTKAAQVLLEKGARLDVVDRGGRTPLDEAVASGNVSFQSMSAATSPSR